MKRLFALFTLLSSMAYADQVFVGGVEQVPVVTNLPAATVTNLTAVTADVGTLTANSGSVTSLGVGTLTANSGSVTSLNAGTLALDGINLASTSEGAEGIRAIGALGGYKLDEFFEDTYMKAASRDKPVFVHATAPVQSLVVTWSGGDVYSPADGYFHLSSGSTTNIDNAVNYAYWDVAYSNDVRWTTVRPSNGYIVLARFVTAFGSIIQSDYTHAGSDHIIETETAFSDIFPSLIVSDNGLLVSATGTALSNIIQTAGTEYQNMATRREHRTQNLSDSAITYGLVAYGHTNSSQWAYAITNVLPIGMCDTGSNVVSCAADKWYRGAFMSFAGNPYMTWIYPQGSYTSETAAIEGNDPVPPSAFQKYIPLISAYVFRGTDTVLRTETKYWLDRRYMVRRSNPSSGGSGTALTPTLDTVMIAGSSLGGILPHDAGLPTDADQLTSKAYVDYLDDIVKNSFRITKDPTGWEGETDNNRTYLLDPVTRVFTITNASAMNAYIDGILLTNATSLTWPAIGTNQGIWYLSFNHDTKKLVATNVVWALSDVQVATVYWGGGASNATVLIGEETHGFMPWSVHQRIHLIEGSGYANGMDISVTGYTFTNTAGMWVDEDIAHAVDASGRARTMYRSAALSVPVISEPGDAYVVTNGTGLLFDLNGVLTAVPTNDYMSMWCYVNPDTKADYIWVVGRMASNLTTIAAESPYDLNTTFPTAEGVLLYKVTLLNSNGVAVVTDVLDYRKSGITGKAKVFVQHNAMANRDAANSHPLSAITGHENVALYDSPVFSSTAFTLTNTAAARFNISDIPAGTTNVYTLPSEGGQLATYTDVTNLVVSTSNTVSSAITNEAGRAISAEGNLTNFVVNATNTAYVADTNLSARINAETNRAITAETSLSDMVVTASNTLYGIDTNLSARINAETNRAITAETSLSNMVVTASNTLYGIDTNLQTQTTGATNRIRVIELQTNAWNAAATPSAKFLANISVNQTFSTTGTNKVAFSNLVLNVGGSYLNSAARWIPEAASNTLVEFSGVIDVAAVANNDILRVFVFKNGAFKGCVWEVRGDGTGALGNSWVFTDVTAATTDYYEVWVQCPTSTRTMTGAGANNWWSGHVVY